MALIAGPGSTPSGVLTYAWLDPGGTLRDLSVSTSPHLFVSRGTTGLGSPAVELVTDKLPTAAGGIVRWAATRPLEIELPITVMTSSFPVLLQTVEALRGWFDTGGERSRTPGALRITRPQDDVVRQIGCYYTGGLEGDLGPGAPAAYQLVVSLLAPDPYWTGLEPEERTYVAADMGHELGVVNVGDYDAYPIWTLTGPYSNMTITNTTTGKSWGIVFTSPPGGVIFVDTRPASQRETIQIIDNGGNSHFSQLSAGSSLWWLVPGLNTFTIGTSGVSSASRVEVSFLPRYRGALR